MAFCIHCGKQLMEGARFCAFCGKSTNSNIATHVNSACYTAPLSTEEASVKEVKSFDNDQIIVYLRDVLGMEAEITKDGGVRVKARIKKDVSYPLDQAIRVIDTPDGRRLKGIRLPEGITEIGERAFFGAFNLEYVELPSSLCKIGISAFSLCPLKEIHFPESVTYIGDRAFSITQLITVRLPENLKKLGGSAFSCCKNLTEVIFPFGLTEIAGCAFSECKALKSVRIPQGVRCIKNSAFHSCKALVEITFPESVELIEQYAFDYCVNLSTVNMHPDIRIEKDAFRGCKKLDENGKPLLNLKSVTPAKLPPDFDANEVIAHLQNNLGINAEKAEDGGVRITGLRCTKNDEAFVLGRAVKPMFTMSARRMNGVILPEGVTEIADQAFQSADCLEYISLPSTLRVIGEEAFSETGLVEFVIPENATEIGCAVLLNCMSLQKATIKCPVHSVPASMFMGCEELAEVILPSSVQTIEDAAFEQCVNLEKLAIPDHLKSVARGAFCECPSEIISKVKVAFPAYKE